jgi:BTB/POZ domain
VEHQDLIVCRRRIENIQPSVSTMSLNRDMKSLLYNEDYSDFTFFVGGQEFPAHKAIITGKFLSEKQTEQFNLNLYFFSARSLIFKKTFRNSRQSKIPGFSPAAFQEFLNFLYTDKVANMRLHTLELLQMAHLYQVDGLKDVCEAYMITMLTEENAYDYHNYAIRYDLDDLHQAVAGMLQIRNKRKQPKASVPEHSKRRRVESDSNRFALTMTLRGDSCQVKIFK